MYDSIKKELFKEKIFKNMHWLIFKRHIEYVEFKKNEYLTKPNQIEGYLYFIVSGGVKLFYETEFKDINIDFRFENTFTSCYGSFLTQQPSVISMQSIEDTKLIRISYKSMKQLNKYRAGERISKQNAETLFLQKEKREALLLLHEPDSRYLRLMNTNPEWFQRISQKNIASYLDISPETLSRIKKRNL